MTEQQKSTLKIISAIVTIILLPVLFFHFIGENPTKKVSNATREIAVVNEDTGVLKDDGTVDQDALLGNEISASLVDRPDYKWTVVNRSAAESGLAEKQYDAIVYIPSDFSQNILSYNHERPQKAELEFKIQDQLDAVNKEKVQRELQDAQKTVSKKMSSLYWRFVKQGVKKVRKEFDSIVNKESEFQNAMYNFYKPSSNNLAGEVERQKEMIDRLKESINETEGTSKERNASVEESKKQLDSFVDNVNQYKQYQEKQSELLQAAQADSEGQIQDGLTVIKEKQSSATSRFNEQMSGMAASFNGLQNQFSLAGNSLQNLMNYRYDSVPQQQLDKINTIQNDLVNTYHFKTREYALDQLEDSIISTRTQLSKEPDKDSDDKEEPVDIEDIDLNEEMTKLDEISKELSKLSDEIDVSDDEDIQDPDNSAPGDEPSSDIKDQTQPGDGSSSTNDVGDKLNQEDAKGPDIGVKTKENASSDSNSEQEPVSQNEEGVTGENPTSGDESPSDQKGNNLEELKQQLNNISVNVSKVKTDIETKEKDHNEDIEKKVEKLNTKIENLKQDIKGIEEKQSYEIYSKIKETENEILRSPNLIRERSSKLEAVFNSELKSKELNNLLTYFKSISKYQATLELAYPEKGTLLDQKREETKSVLKVNEDENTKWENLKNNMLATSEDIEAYTTDMTDFVKSYGDFINEKQTDVLNELSNISERANAVSEQLSNPVGAGTAVFEGDATDGTMVISMQDTLGNDILQLSNMLGSLSETQSGVIEYTGNIQESVNDVQKKADTLNSNWGQNVATTKLIRGDVYGILGNAFGGNDGYVYDHLASPVKISGDVPESKAQNVPPVVILVIVMLSSLLIGYFSHHYQNAPLLVRGALFGILNIIVGLMISLFGLNIYALADDQAVMWSVFTILLLVASSAIIRTAFMLGSIAGGIATAAMVLFYVAPLLDLAMPNFSFNNPVSTVYMSIQYGTGSQFALGIGALILITIIAIAVPFIVDFAKSRTEESETDHDA
ncbi:type VII secretion protein EsaA [Bacillus haynesii]|uniref:type VII secretion protein EsaA n=1 Tax=Bacillus haynesii TaxID=1925021 RepID=UPI0022827CFE|nr:type VII secretion protein EsaA [Bacillus haynesii]MCY8370244.1 type VII secretion protein EsaA [Bacillus haynesii]